MHALWISTTALALALLAMPHPALAEGTAAEPTPLTRTQVVADLLAWRESGLQLLARSEDIDFGRGPAFAKALARYQELKALAATTTKTVASSR